MRTNREQAYVDIQMALRRARRNLPLEMVHIQGLRFVERLLAGLYEMDELFEPEPDEGEDNE